MKVSLPWFLFIWLSAAALAVDWKVTSSINRLLVKLELVPIQICIVTVFPE